MSENNINQNSSSSGTSNNDDKVEPSPKRRKVCSGAVAGAGAAGGAAGSGAGGTAAPALAAVAQMVPAVEDDLLCAITLQLPYEPVTAEDGRIYERSAIENHIKSKHDKMELLKSPITHEKMGSKLLPSPQIKNTIDTLIKRGVITGELADNWKEKDQLKKEMDELIKDAENGDLESMYMVGLDYRFGNDGFPQDYKKAYMWFEKAHNAGCKEATMHMAHLLLHGRGVAKHQQQGIAFLSIAAADGSDAAAFALGKAFAVGSYELGIRKADAIKWLKVAVSGKCAMEQMNDDGKQHAKKLLDELENAPSASSSS